MLYSENIDRFIKKIRNFKTSWTSTVMLNLIKFNKNKMITFSWCTENFKY